MSTPSLYIKKSTPHSFMWFCDGKKIPENALPIPSGEVDYVKALKRECAKCAKTNTPVYLIYLGRLLSDAQKKAMMNLASTLKIPNLYMVDYDTVEKKINNPTYSTEISKLAINTGIGIHGIGELVDTARLVLLENCDILKQAAMEENPTRNILLENSSDGLIYRDMDVSLKEDANGDIMSTDSPHEGFLCSTNYITRIEEIKKLLLAKGTSEQEIHGFLEKNIYNTEQFTRLGLYQYSRQFRIEIGLPQDIITAEEEYNTFCHEATALGVVAPQNLLSMLCYENSLIAVDKTKHPIIQEICRNRFIESESIDRSDTSYECFNIILSRHRSNIMLSLTHTLKLSHSIFHIGHDETWNTGAIKIQYTLDYNGEPLLKEQSDESEKHTVIVSSDMTRQQQASSALSIAPGSSSDAFIATAQTSSPLATTLSSKQVTMLDKIIYACINGNIRELAVVLSDEAVISTYNDTKYYISDNIAILKEHAKLASNWSVIPGVNDEQKVKFLLKVGADKDMREYIDTIYASLTQDYNSELDTIDPVNIDVSASLQEQTQTQAIVAFLQSNGMWDLFKGTDAQRIAQARRNNVIPSQMLVGLLAGEASAPAAAAGAGGGSDKAHEAVVGRRKP